MSSHRSSVLDPGPLAAQFYADAARQTHTAIVEHEQLAKDTFRFRVHCPQIARAIVPGQFIMVRLVGCDDPLLARPLALYDTVLDDDQMPIGLDIVYLVVGKMTARLARLRPGAELEIWGPLGNGFAPSDADHLIMVAGGIGQTPFMALSREALGSRTYGHPPRDSKRARRVSLCYGARSAALLAGVPDFQAAGVQVHVSTDDGSHGHRGLVTDLLEQQLATVATSASRVVTCGPEPMMEAVARICAAQQVPCQVSLETPMACGVGICFSCVTRVRQGDGTWDYKRTCVDGPVFDAECIAW